jgi:hypothetical protein
VERGDIVLDLAVRDDLSGFVRALADLVIADLRDPAPQPAGEE